MTKELTSQQQLFVIEYIRNGFNAYQAALVAGYSEDTANDQSYQLLNHPIIHAQITKAHKIYEKQRYQQEFKDACMTLTERVKALSKIVYAIVPKDDSSPVDVRNADKAIKAIAEINKLTGDYAPDKRLAITVDATQDRLIEARKQYSDY